MESNTLYASVKNGFSRTALAKRLTAVVAATTDATKQATVPPTNYATLPIEDVQKLQAADPTLVLLGPVSADGKTQAIQASAAGIAAVQAAPAIVEKVKPAAPQGGFAIETGVALPPIKRGGERVQLYPFDKLEIGQSFFVPNTESMPNAGKTLASTVSSMTRRYKTETPARVFTIRAEALGADGVTKGARIWRISPSEATPAQASGTDATATAAPSTPLAGFQAPTA